MFSTYGFILGGEMGIVLQGERGTIKLHHCVYVIELDNVVMKDKRFREANPDFCNKKLCVYVGMTGLSPEQRFQNHREGNKSNKYAHRYGMRLLPELYEIHNPMTYKQAQTKECELADMLRSCGYAVWQA